MNEITNIDVNKSVWSTENAEKIRSLVAPTLNKDEFALFMELGKNLGANPFTREIWAVKYDKDKPAQIFCSRDFYRRKAQEQSDYTGHTVQSICANDEVEIENGMIKMHKPNIKNPGALILAYCVVNRKNMNPFFHTVRCSEYNKGQSQWKSMPETMLKKVAEAQALRMAYQGTFRGTYDESEAPLIIDVKPEVIKETTEKPKTLAEAAGKQAADLKWKMIEPLVTDELKPLLKGMKKSEVIALFEKHNNNVAEIMFELTPAASDAEAAAATETELPE